MATMRCPNCQTEIQKPTNVLAWILGTIAVGGLGLFMLVIVCLAAITSIGAVATEDGIGASADIQAVSYEQAETGSVELD